MKTPFKRFLRTSLKVISLSLIISFGFSGSVLASPYGRSAYGNCFYQICATSTSTPSGKGTNNASSTPSIIQQITRLPGQIFHGAEHFVSHLPRSVKYGLPYFLFIVLIFDCLLLFFQIRKEVRESKYLLELIKREKESGELKKSFISLVSHYLRTPITVLAGSIDLLGKPEGEAATSVNNVRSDVQTLNAKVDNLISQAAEQANAVVSVQDDRLLNPKPSWQQPLFYIPVISVVVVVFAFDYLVQHSGSFSISQINLIVQGVLLGSTIVLLYFVARSLRIRRINIIETRHLLEKEVGFNQSRDRVIEETALELSGTLGSLDTHIAQLPTTSPANDLVKSGQRRLHDVVDKFVVAKQLKGAGTASPPVTTKLSAICGPALQLLQTKMQTKGIQVNFQKDISFQTPSPELLSLVMQTVLDNAVEYSPPQNLVEVGSEAAGAELTITVTDNGPGIPADKQSALFQAFSKIEGAEVFNHEGMGFSLYLDKIVMTYLRGGISVEAVTPHGTKVVLKFPITANA